MPPFREERSGAGLPDPVRLCADPDRRNRPDLAAAGVGAVGRQAAVDLGTVNYDTIFGASLLNIKGLSAEPS